jgi:hypothetical protein
VHRVATRRLAIAFVAAAAVAAATLASACSDPEWNPDGGATLGGVYVAQRGCPSCHQSGDARLGTLSGSCRGLGDLGFIFAPNLTPDVATGLGGWADVQIVRALRAGVDDENVPLYAPMPVFTDMTDLEAYSIVAFLRTLPPVHHDVSEATCLIAAPPVRDFSVPLDFAELPDAAGDFAAPPDGGAGD